MLIAGRLPRTALDVMAAQLAHGKSGALAMACDRADSIRQGRTMMTASADDLDRLRTGAEVRPFNEKSA
jgi:hypothetical protein